MATEIVAPNEYPAGKFMLFLAGAIDMGQAEDWQVQVVSAFANDDLIILNPRRPEFNPDTLDEQIKWELHALEDCSMIFLWFPRASKAPISFFEAGLWWSHSKLIVGAEYGFYRRRNLELTSEWHGRKLFYELDEMIWYVRNRLEQRFRNFGLSS
jgi:hypothetical protein